MIIVSQDKKAIVNFDNVNEIRVSTNKIVIFDNTYDVSGDCSDVLGTYNTEERAKEVLQEIVKLISEDEFYHIRKSQLNSLDGLEEPKYILKPVSRPKVYEMPEE